MLQSFGVEVLGLDLSENMVNIALDRAFSEKMPSVSLTSLTHLAHLKPAGVKTCAHCSVLCTRSSSRWPTPPGGRSRKVLST